MTSTGPAVRGLNPLKEGKNRFRFVRFGERLAAVDIDVAHRLGTNTTSSEPEDGAGTFVGAALQQWRELNCTLHFATFCRDVQPHTLATLPLLLLHRDRIVECFVTHLRVPGSQALKPLLSLTADLARDLRDDFYPLFPTVFHALVRLINPMDVPLLEDIFNTLSYLFKYLMKYLVRDVDQVFLYFSDLLATAHKPYIRQFAAESFAYLLRKVPEDRIADVIRGLLLLVYTRAEEHHTDAGDFSEGVGMLLFELVKGVKHGFHSRASTTYGIILDALTAKVVSVADSAKQQISIMDNAITLKKGLKKKTAAILQAALDAAQNTEATHKISKPRRLLKGKHHQSSSRSYMDDECAGENALVDCIVRMNELMAEFGLVEHVKFVWDALLPRLSGHGQASPYSAPPLCNIMTVWIRHRRGARISDTAPVFETVCKVATWMNDVANEETRERLLFPAIRMLRAIIEFGSSAVISMRATPLLKPMMKWLPVDAVMFSGFAVLHSLMAAKAPVSVYLPLATQYCEQHVHTALAETAIFAAATRHHILEANLPTCAPTFMASDGHLLWPKSSNSIIDMLDNSLSQILKACSSSKKGNNGKKRTLDSDISVTSSIVVDPKDSTEPVTQIAYAQWWAWLHGCQQLSTADPEHCIDICAKLLDYLITHYRDPVKRFADVVVPKAFSKKHKSDSGAASSEIITVDGETISSAIEWEDAPVLEVVAETIRCLTEHGRKSVETLLVSQNDLLLKVVKLLGVKSSRVMHAFNMFLEVIDLSSHPQAKTLLSTKTLEDLYVSLRSNLSSPLSAMRLHTLSVLCKYEQPTLPPVADLPATVKPVVEKFNLFAQCLEAEKLEKDLQNFRELLMLAQRLSRYGRTARVPAQFQCVSTRYLLGLLTINLRVIWEPVQELLREEADTHEAVVWSICGRRLIQLNQENLINRDALDAGQSAVNIRKPDTAAVSTVSEMAVIDVDGSFHHSRTEGMFGERVDDLNTFNLLMSMFAGCPNIIERRSREIIPLFLHLMDVEYPIVYEGAQKQQDLGFLSITDTDDTKNDDEDEEEDSDEEVAQTKDKKAKKADGDEDDDDDDDEKEKEKEETTSAVIEHGTQKSVHALADNTIAVHEDARRAQVSAARKSVSRRLNSFLELLAEFKNPKSLYQSQRLLPLYLDLLTRSDTVLQKLVLKCVYTYKLPYVTPYQDMLDHLCSEDKFRDALTQFSVDEESRTVAVDHADDLMPMVIRILYAKMFGRRGMGGKNTLRTRRNAVLTFLAGCRTEDRATLIALVLEPFEGVMLDSSVESIEAIQKPLNPHAVTPLRKQLGFLNLLHDLCKQLGFHLEPFLDRVLQPLLRLVFCAHSFLESTTVTVHPRHMTALKEVRLHALKRLASLYNEFPKNNRWSAYTSTVFAVCISPRLERLVNESQQSASGMLELLCVWSKHKELAHLLVSVDNTVLPRIFSLLSMPKTQDAVIDVIVELAESLLDLSDQDETVKAQVFKPHVGSLLDHLQSMMFSAGKAEQDSLLEAKRNDAKVGRPRIKAFKFSTRFSRRGLTLLSRLSLYATNPKFAEQAVQLLMPFLSTSQAYRLSDDSVADVLGIFAGAVRLLPATDALCSFFSQLFQTIKARQCRTKLVDLFASYAEADERVAASVRFLRLLNSSSILRLDEPDYDDALAAFAVLTGGDDLSTDHVPFVATSDTALAPLNTPLQWIPILHSCIHFLRFNDDFAMRDNASQTILRLIRHIAAVRKMQGLADTAPLDMNDSWQELLPRIILPAIKRAMTSLVSNCRSEGLLLLAECARLFPAHDAMAEMQKLLAQDPHEEDSVFFTNVRHIQVHRRARAMRQLAQACRDGFVGQKAVTNYFFPLIQHVLFENTEVHEHNFVDDAIACISEMSRTLPWGRYQMTLRRFLSQAVHKPVLKKTLLKVIVAMLDSFHFDLTPPNNDANLSESMTEGEQTEDVETAEIGAPTGDDEEAEEMIDADAAVPANVEGEDSTMLLDAPPSALTALPKVYGKNPGKVNIFEALLTKILPELYRHLVKRDKDGEDADVHTPVALAMTKLLIAMPAEETRGRLPPVITRIAHVLRSRNQDVREQARNTLVSMASIVDPSYVGFFVTELRTALDRGFRVHVLSFTIHALLVDCVRRLPPGSLDYCAADIMDVVYVDTFGTVAEEKNIQMIIAKTKEARSKKGQEMFELMAKHVSGDALPAILDPLKVAMSTDTNQKHTRKIAECLQRVGVGLNANTLITEEQLLVIVYSLVHGEGSLSEPTGAATAYRNKPVEMVDGMLYRRNERLENTFLIKPRQVYVETQLEDHFKVNAYLLAEFGLSVLYTALKRDRFQQLSPERLVSLLDPLVPMLVSVMYSKQVRCVILALRCLGTIVGSPLPSLEKNGGVLTTTLVTRLFKLLNNAGTGNLGGEMVQAVLRLLVAVLRDRTSVPLTDGQFAVLLVHLRAGLQQADRQSTAFGLLRTLVARRYNGKGLAETIDQVRDMSIRAYDSAVRRQCRMAFVQYVVTYSLPKKRIEEEVNFVCRHLSFVDQLGRESALEAMLQLIERLTAEQVQSFSKLFFLSLCMTIANDESADCRKMSAVNLGALVNRLEGTELKECIEILVKWMEAPVDNSAGVDAISRVWTLKRVGTQVAGILLRQRHSEKAGGKSVAEHLLPTITHHCLCISAEQAEAYWEVPYHALKSLSSAVEVDSKLLHHPNRTVNVEADTLWETIVSLLKHSHAWVKLAAGQLCGLQFASLDVVKVSEKSVAACPLLGTSAGQASFIDAFCRQMESPLLDDVLGQQLVKCLLFLTRCILQRGDRNGEAGADDGKDESEIVKDDDDEMEEVEDGEEEEDDEEESEGDEEEAVSKKAGAKHHHQRTPEKKHPGLYLMVRLLRRLSFIARSESARHAKSTVKRMHVFKFFAGLTKYMDSNTLALYLQIMLSPLYRTLNTSEAKANEDLKGFAQEVQDLLQSQCNRNEFFAVYGKVREEVSKVRSERKRKRAVESVVDPASFAKRKLQKNMNKREQRKKKIDVIKGRSRQHRKPE